MASSAIDRVGQQAPADKLLAMAADRGSASHPYVSSPRLLGGADAMRNLADAVHYLCMFHGRFPGVIDLAAERAKGGTQGWLRAAADRFADERAWLTRLVVAAGPLPSTPGQAESQAAVVAQHHALETLARSDRHGCAPGAALALLLDWGAIRAVLDVAAERCGVDPLPVSLPNASEVGAIAAAQDQKHARALTFGAQQFLLQHRGLWDVLEAREAARRG